MNIQMYIFSRLFEFYVVCNSEIFRRFIDKIDGEWYNGCLTALLSTKMFYVIEIDKPNQLTS